jgi:hypothetical protein
LGKIKCFLCSHRGFNLRDPQQNIATIDLAEELDISRSNIAVAYEADRRPLDPGHAEGHAMMFAGICNA